MSRISNIWNFLESKLLILQLFCIIAVIIIDFSLSLVIMMTICLLGTFYCKRELRRRGNHKRKITK